MQHSRPRPRRSPRTRPSPATTSRSTPYPRKLRPIEDRICRMNGDAHVACSRRAWIAGIGNLPLPPSFPAGDDRAMASPQTGIFALGTASHGYLELDLAASAEAEVAVARVAALREPRTT